MGRRRHGATEVRRRRLALSRNGRLAMVEATVFGLAFPVYYLVRGLTEGRAEEAVRRSEQLMRLEKQLYLFWEPDLQQLVLPYRPLVEALNAVYLWGHLPVIVALAVGLYFWRRDVYLLMRNAFLISGGIGLVIFATLPVAPPRLTPGSGLVDTVQWASSSAGVIQPAAFVNQYASVPSLHFGWNLLVGVALGLAVRHPLSRILAAAMPLAMLSAVVLTGNHYLLDGLAGLAVVALGLLLAVALRRLGLACRRATLPKPSSRSYGNAFCWLAGVSLSGDSLAAEDEKGPVKIGVRGAEPPGGDR